MHNPLADNPLATRQDIQTAAEALLKPLAPHYSPGSARLRLGLNAAGYGPPGSEVEAFGRALWGLVPLVAGGGQSGLMGTALRGIEHGVDPDHPEYWGKNFYISEFGTLGAMLALAPGTLWEPLSDSGKQNLSRALAHINTLEMYPNNWRFWRVLVNLGLKTVGEPFDEDILHKELDFLETFHVGDGWYTDGKDKQPDYYIPFAMHFYALIYAKVARASDPERARRFKQYAADFAKDFIYWFAGDGAGLPYGRSLFYRFAQGAFWGALALADVESLPWGVVKGLYLRHLRWWQSQPIYHPSGVLSVGYTYPNSFNSETYAGPGAPYWAFKFFLPLALPETHPFWEADPEPLPRLDPVKPLRHAGMVICRDDTRDHVVSLNSTPHTFWMHRPWPQRYCKFAYSTRFGFSVPTAPWGLGASGLDSMLALSEEDAYFRVRQINEEAYPIGDALYARWRPYPNVEVETWLIPAGPWHVRVHRLNTKRDLISAEGGFAAPYRDSDPVPGQDPLAACKLQGPGFAAWDDAQNVSGLIDLIGQRTGETAMADRGSNLIHPQAFIPFLKGEHPAGEHLLACAVIGLPGEGGFERLRDTRPACQAHATGFAVRDAAGSLLFEHP